MSWLWAFGQTPEFSAVDVHGFIQKTLSDDHPLRSFKEATFIDVRTQGEYDGGHIPAGDKIRNESVVPPWSLRSRLEALKVFGRMAQALAATNKHLFS